MLEKYRGQIETKFSTFCHQMMIAIHSKKQFRSGYIKYIVQCLNEEFERFAMSKLSINDSRYCWQSLS